LFHLGLTPQHPCDYLPDEQSRSLVVIDEHRLSPEAYEFLLARGFRRSGSHAYRPWCDHCRQCVAVRIPVSRFHPNRSQRRTLERNRDLEERWTEARGLNDEQWTLYHDYLQARHGESGMAKSDRAASEEFLFSPWARTRLMELRLGQKLLAVAVTDMQPRSLSALYTFFDPREAKRSLGSYAILRQIELARSGGRPWLYLGYWIPSCRKMSYKANFLPVEVRKPESKIGLEEWLPLTSREERARFLAELATDRHSWSRASQSR